MKPLKFVTFLFVVSALPLASQASDLTMGQAEFMNSCAQCHGPAGKGDGVIAGYLNTAIPDLTQIQKANGGVFPVSQIYETIEGRSAAGAHGSTDMPAWGLRYSRSAPEMLGLYYGPQDQEAFIRSRILGLVEFISSIQE
jgi:mono/diheme cytochrome c family protein